MIFGWFWGVLSWFLGGFRLVCRKGWWFLVVLGVFGCFLVSLEVVVDGFW